MLLLLSILLFLIAYIAYYFSHKDIMSPTFLLSLCLFLVAAIAYFFRFELGGDIHGYTVLAVVGGTVSFGIGEMIGRIVGKRRKVALTSRPMSFVLPSKTHLVLMAVFILGTVYFSYRFFMSIASLYGVSDFATAYGVVRSYFVDIDNEGSEAVLRKSTVLVLAENLSTSIAFYSLYLYCYMRFIRKRPMIWLLFPYIACIPFYLFQTGGRMAYLQLATSVVSVVYMMKKQGRLLGESEVRIGGFLKSLLKYVPLVLLLFFLLGAIRSGKDSETDWVRTICAYSGSSFIGLDRFLTENYPRCLDSVTGEYLGERTIRPFLAFLNKFGADFELMAYHDEFYRFPAGTSNIYSAFKYLVEDFSMWGMFFVCFLLGLFYIFMWNRFRYNRMNIDNAINYLFLSFMFHGLVMMPLVYSLPNLIIINIGLVLKLIYLWLIQRIYSRKTGLFVRMKDANRHFVRTVKDLSCR